LELEEDMMNLKEQLLKEREIARDEKIALEEEKVFIYIQIVGIKN
jgi:hypothetical protein